MKGWSQSHTVLWYFQLTITFEACCNRWIRCTLCSFTHHHSSKKFCHTNLCMSQTRRFSSSSSGHRLFSKVKQLLSSSKEEFWALARNRTAAGGFKVQSHTIRPQEQLFCAFYFAFNYHQLSSCCCCDSLLQLAECFLHGTYHTQINEWMKGYLGTKGMKVITQTTTRSFVFTKKHLTQYGSDHSSFRLIVF